MSTLAGYSLLVYYITYKRLGSHSLRIHQSPTEATKPFCEFEVRIIDYVTRPVRGVRHGRLNTIFTLVEVEMGTCGGGVTVLWLTKGQ